jgi:hypothetical protein
LSAIEPKAGRIALQTVFERWPTIRLAGDLEYADNFNVRILRARSPSPRLEREEITSRQAARTASLRVMTMIFMVRRGRVAVMGLALAGSVLG